LTVVKNKVNRSNACFTTLCQSTDFDDQSNLSPIVIAKMAFTLKQNKFIIMSYYRNGIKRDGEWTYSVQACKEEFLANYPDQNILEKSLAAHINRIVDRFVATGSVEKGKSSGRPKVMEDVVENI
jgi:hypothetical protein